MRRGGSCAECGEWRECGRRCGSSGVDARTRASGTVEGCEGRAEEPPPGLPRAVASTAPPPAPPLRRLPRAGGGGARAAAAANGGCSHPPAQHPAGAPTPRPPAAQRSVDHPSHHLSRTHRWALLPLHVFACPSLPLSVFLVRCVLRCVELWWWCVCGGLRVVLSAAVRCGGATSTVWLGWAQGTQSLGARRPHRRVDAQ